MPLNSLTPGLPRRLRQRTFRRTGRHRARSQRRVGFSLVELLVVMGIVAALVSALLPAVAASREAARRTICTNNLKQLTLAAQNHEGTHGSYPQARDEKFWSWLAYLLPQMEQQSLYDQMDLARAPYSPSQAHVAGVIMPSFLCPADTGNEGVSPNPKYTMAYTNYFAVSGTDGGVAASQYEGAGITPSSAYKDDLGPRISARRVTDGLSKTLLVGERPVIGEDINGNGDVGWWAGGIGYRRAPYGRADYILDVSEGLWSVPVREKGLEHATHFWSGHPAGTQFAYAGGSVAMLSYDIDQVTLEALATRNGGEVARP